MEKLKLKSKLTIGLLIFSVFVQSCKVYQKMPVSIEQAVNSNKKQFIKVKTYDGRIYHLRRISEIDGQLYGSKKKEGEVSALPFGTNDIETIQFQNITLSTIGTVALFTGLGIAVTSIAASYLFDFFDSFTF